MKAGKAAQVIRTKIKIQNQYLLFVLGGFHFLKRAEDGCSKQTCFTLTLVVWWLWFSSAAFLFYCQVCFFFKLMSEAARLYGVMLYHCFKKSTVFLEQDKTLCFTGIFLCVSALLITSLVLGLRFGFDQVDLAASDAERGQVNDAGLNRLPQVALLAHVGFGLVGLQHEVFERQQFVLLCLRHPLNIQRQEPGQSEHRRLHHWNLEDGLFSRQNFE